MKFNTSGIHTAGPANVLVIGISSSALFDTRESDKVYQDTNLESYVAHQIGRENNPFPKGTAFPLVETMMRLNKTKVRIELVVISKNEPEAGLRVMNSLAHYGFKNTRAAFTGGEPVAKFCKPFRVSLFLSREIAEVKEALILGVAAGVLYDPPNVVDVDVSQLRIAFDFDGVLASTESEEVYKSQGIDIYREHETKLAKVPLPKGPLYPVLKLLADIKHELAVSGGQVVAGVGKVLPPIEIALVTARNPPADTRLMLTLRSWGIRVDQMFLLGGLPKEPVLKQFRPHIFFDDQETHTIPASGTVATSLVPWVQQEIPAVTEAVSVSIKQTADKSSAIRPEVTKTLRYPTVKEFDATCRRVFGSYMPTVDGKPARLDERFRGFISENRERSGPERAAILERLLRADLSKLDKHQPMLNRDRANLLVNKLKFIAEGNETAGDSDALPEALDSGA